MSESVQILHVDDDASFAELTAEMLESRPRDVGVKTVTDPEAALEFLRTACDDIDCIVTDYRMPTLTGIDLLQRLKTQYPDQDWPCILFTGEGNEEVAADALHAGASSYVQKGGPDSFEHLWERIRRDLQSARARRNSARFGALADAIDDPVYVVDENGRFVYVNEAFVELTGYDRETVLGSSPRLIKPAASAESAEEHLGEILSDDGPDSVTFEIDIETIDGRRVVCEDHMGVLPYEGDSFQGSIGTLRDISEQKAYEQAIAEMKNKYQTLVEQNLVGLYIARDGEVIYHNGQFADLFGYERNDEELVGTHLTDLVKSDDQLRLAEMIRETERGDRESIREPYIGVRSDGSPVQLELLARGISLDGGPAVIGSLLEMNDESGEMSQMRAERDRLAEFTNVVSHDLRNPLSVAKGRAELLASEVDADEHTAVLTRNLERMDAIIADLLTLARDGEALGATESVRLDTVVTDCWETVATPGAELVVTTDPERRLSADQSRLRQLFENLYRNAVEHGGEDVTITVGDLDDGFYVADDGPGVDGDAAGQIFTPGYSTSEAGTGFGLSIVDQIVAAHGWRVQHTSSESGGARFEITGIEFTERRDENARTP